MSQLFWRNLRISSAGVSRWYIISSFRLVSHLGVIEATSYHSGSRCWYGVRFKLKFGCSRNLGRDAIVLSSHDAGVITAVFNYIWLIYVSVFEYLVKGIWICSLQSQYCKLVLKETLWLSFEHWCRKPLLFRATDEINDRVRCVCTSVVDLNSSEKCCFWQSWSRLVYMTLLRMYYYYISLYFQVLF